MDRAVSFGEIVRQNGSGSTVAVAGFSGPGAITIFVID
jgi:hypothetical protein